MKKKWIEHSKTVSLVLLITLSFILTGYLWYSSPSYEEKKPDDPYPPPSVSTDAKKYNKDGYELVSPYQLVIHQAGKASWVLPENDSYKPLIKTISQATFTSATPIQPSTLDWNKISQLASGVELQYPHDLNINYLDAFFRTAGLSSQPYLNKLDQISRVWIYVDPLTKQVNAWFISDNEQKIIQASLEVKGNQLENLISKSSKDSTIPLVAIPTNNKAPWDLTNKDQPNLSRVLYLPSDNFPVNEVIYNTSEILPEEMNQWLFKEKNLEPIPFNSESLYMYNDQLLTYNKDDKFIIYKDTSSKVEEPSIISEDLDKINQFVKRHNGWTGSYLLDDINQEEGNKYIFRLFLQGYPVYWSPGDKINPDTIQLQFGTNGVSNYTRSLIYLSGDPTETHSDRLPGKDDLLKLLDSKGIPLPLIERIFPGYQAKFKKSQVILKPVWVVMTRSKTTLFITSP